MPALLVVYSVTHQPGREAASASNAAIIDATADSQQVAGVATQQPSDPQPINQAEQATIAEQQPQPETVATPSAEPVCDQGKKQAATAAKESQIAQENAQHAQQNEKLRLISMVYRKYWDEEVARHQNALNQIEATYQAAVAAANC